MDRDLEEKIDAYRSAVADTMVASTVESISDEKIIECGAKEWRAFRDLEAFIKKHYQRKGVPWWKRRA